MVSFLQLAAEKKDTIFGVARKFFGPSYFVTALGPSLQAQLYIHLATVKLSLFLQSLKAKNFRHSTSTFITQSLATYIHK